MIRTQVYIPTDLYQEAKLYAHIAGKSISDFMREGLRTAIIKQKKHVKKEKRFTLLDMAGKYRFPGKKKTNVAATHNDIYDI